MESHVDENVKWLHSEEYSDASGILGEPQKTTRIGDQYQAQIPTLMPQDERLQLTKLPATSYDYESHLEFGLPIPVTWIHNQIKNKEESTEIQTNATGEYGNVGCGTDNGLLPFPCSSSEESWSMIERESFLLGLYIFGKNLRVVNKFVGNKGMQKIVSYYYGKFYRSDEHQKWAMCRKKSSRMSTPGKKIFKGWRHQELMSRLLPNLKDESKTHLTQICSMFENGELSYEKYVLKLRDIVGINLLVEAVAIGKEKQDLTTKAKNRGRNKKSLPSCSSLKTEEIVSILKDRVGLSKTRLNELFWEAVWPRLLANGWHSEQPGNKAFHNSKKSLVFLAPGVAKFSRRSLFKGIQYFDSFNEVLTKVALEPHLLEHKNDSEMEVSTIGQPIREMKLTSKPKSRPQQVNNIINDKRIDELVPMEDASSEKNHLKIVIGLKSHRVAQVSNADKSCCSTKQKVFPETSSNQHELPCPGATSQSIKEPESLADGFMNTTKKRTQSDDKTRRRVRAKTAHVSSCGAGNNEYKVDGVFNGSSHMVSKSPKSHEVDFQSK